MTDQPRTPYLGRYVLILIGATIAVFVLRYILAEILGVELSAGGLALLPPLLAAMLVGQQWARDRGEVPTSAQAWRWALVTGVVFLALQVLLTPLALLTIPGPLDGSLAMILALGIVFFTAIAIFVHRFFLVMGARGVMKDRDASKGK